jgi:hypothetical protein
MGKNALRRSTAMGQITDRKRVIRLGILVVIFAGAAWMALYPPDLLQSLLGSKSIAGVVNLLEKTRPEIVQLAAGAGDGLTLAAFKREKTLELHSNGRLLKRYPFTGFSGTLGPKVKEGDRQIPEGVYGAASLNPNSRFHLSIEVGYPNTLEKDAARKEGRDHLGGEIFIHGGRASIGCIPIGNEAIEEVFYLVAKAGLKKTRIVIAPYDLRNGRDAGVDAEVLKTTPWAGAAYREIEKALSELPRN